MFRNRAFNFPGSTRDEIKILMVQGRALFLAPTDTEEIRAIILSLKIQNSTGFDNVSLKLF